MLIVIFGASGKVGRLAVAEALARGHRVRAFVHRHSNLPANPALVTVRGDIANPEEVLAAIQGCEAVISTLGSWGTASKDIVATGVRHCLPAMKQAGIDRIITLTGAEARDATDKPKMFQRLTHILAKLAAGKILADGEEHIRLLRGSGLDWTALRSPVMTGSPRIFYKLSLSPPNPWETIPRRAVAKAILDQLDGPAYSKTAPFIRAY
jgi:putative NADH-flavin reductase